MSDPLQWLLLEGGGDARDWGIVVGTGELDELQHQYSTAVKAASRWMNNAGDSLAPLTHEKQSRVIN